MSTILFLRKFFQDLPVLVWIYGGGYMAGSSSLDMYNPEEIVKRGNIIFVSMQYRVGSHGFLHFGKDSSSPGNVGLLDQVSNFHFNFLRQNFIQIQLMLAYMHSNLDITNLNIVNFAI